MRLRERQIRRAEQGHGQEGGDAQGAAPAGCCCTTATWWHHHINGEAVRNTYTKVGGRTAPCSQLAGRRRGYTQSGVLESDWQRQPAP